jgi:dCTP deaminase
MILNDRQITELCTGDGRPMITPFVSEKVRKAYGVTPVISFGLSSFGYDVMLGPEFKVLRRDWHKPLDPKHINPDAFITYRVSNYIDLEPHQFVLASTIERFQMPLDVIGFCMGKSTYRRCGLVYDMTPLEPEWEGQLTLEFNPLAPVRLYVGEGIAQIVFHRGDVPMNGYGEGKYQNQHGVTLARL